MSYSIAVPSPSLAGWTLAEVLDQCGMGAVSVSEEVDLAGPWPRGILHLSLAGQSARGVEVNRNEEALVVRIMACSSRADIDLALALVRTTAPGDDAVVELEEGGLMPLSRALATCDAAWCAQQWLYGLRTLTGMVDRDGSVVTLPGAVRPYHVGPVHLARLRARGGDLNEVLAADLLASQFPRQDGIFEASVMKVGKDGDGFTMAVIGPGVRYLLPDVERFALAVGNEPLIIPRDLLPTVLDVRPMDEKQYFLDPVPEDHWTEVIASAQAALVPAVDEDDPEPPKPWWKFW
ncbi:MAG: hypothetical protein H6742_10375 [Alphaproteobacteria bacterium]|nr:hypothetical protein [Alphaproteobacteria bacterium]